EDIHEFQVDVVTALDGSDPTTCASHPSRCITSRRRVTSLAHTPLTLPIANDMDCVGVSCDPASTCYRGMCVNATMDAAACASPEGCTPSTEGGVPGARSSDDGAPDGATGADASGGADAGADATGTGDAGGGDAAGGDAGGGDAGDSDGGLTDGASDAGPLP